MSDSRRRSRQWRLTIFGRPAAPWRETRKEAQDDAIAANLGGREHGIFYVTVPGDLVSREVELPLEAG